MERPNNEIVDQIESILQDIKDMQEAIPDLKKRANQLAMKISSLPSEDRLEAAAFLYWMHPEIHSKVLAEATIGEPKIKPFLKAIGSVTAGISCTRCGELIEITSRENFKWVTTYQNTILCDDCKEIESSEWSAENERHEREKAKRLNKLRNMSYQEYLRTPEWQERRNRHLKSAGYRCQVCNGSTPPLDVHHRTYERRGQEYYKDLIVLCRDCHGLYHKKGKLPLENETKFHNKANSADAKSRAAG
jgi:transcription elongation factor Elf1